mgnify:CR=1 FL=1
MPIPPLNTIPSSSATGPAVRVTTAADGNGATAAASQPAQGGFATHLQQAMQSLNQEQLQAQQAGDTLLAGQSTDVADVIIQTERASLSLEMAMAVRNKALEAYQEIMRTPL